MTTTREGTAVHMTHGGILVVEDDPDIRGSLRDVLEDEGYRVVTACDGLDALRALDEIARPCLILLDLMMPVMDGAEFLDHMRRRRELSDVKVMVVSAWPDAASSIEATGFVSKPIDLEALLEKVARYC